MYMCTNVNVLRLVESDWGEEKTSIAHSSRTPFLADGCKGLCVGFKIKQNVMTITPTS